MDDFDLDLEDDLQPVAAPSASMPQPAASNLHRHTSMIPPVSSARPSMLASAAIPKPPSSTPSIAVSKSISAPSNGPTHSVNLNQGMGVVQPQVPVQSDVFDDPDVDALLAAIPDPPNASCDTRTRMLENELNDVLMPSNAHDRLEPEPLLTRPPRGPTSTATSDAWSRACSALGVGEGGDAAGLEYTRLLRRMLSTVTVSSVTTSTAVTLTLPLLLLRIEWIAGGDSHALVSVSDDSGTMPACVCARVVDEMGGNFHVGAVLLLRRVSVFSPTPGAAWLNIAPQNVSAWWG